MAEKALCLHGFGSNKHSLRRSSFTKLLEKYYDLVYINAPHSIVQAFYDPNDEETHAFGWFYYDEEDNSKVDWSNIVTDDLSKLIGYQESLNLLTEILKDESITLIYGFSQGAAILSLMVTLNMIPSHIKKIIFGCGFSPYSIHREQKIQIPSLHIIGRHDSVIKMDMSISLSEEYISPVIVIHEGKHVIDNKSCYKIIYKRFLESK